MSKPRFHMSRLERMELPVYLLRWFGITIVAWHSLRKPLSALFRTEFLYRAVDYFAALNSYRALFYGLMPAVLAILFLRGRWLGRFGAAGKTFASAAAGAACGLAPLLFVRLESRGSFWPLAFGLACFYLGINAAALVFLESFEESGPASKVRVWMKRGFLAADMLLPTLVYASYNRTQSFFRAFFRPLPAISAILPCVLLALLHPADLAERFPPPSAMRKMTADSKPLWDFKTDPGEKIIWASTQENIARYDLSSQTKTFTAPRFRGNGINAFGIDEERKFLLAADFEEGVYRLLKFDADTLKQVRSVRYHADVETFAGASSTLWDVRRDILAVVFEGAAVRFSPDMGRMTALLSFGSMATDAVLDPERRLIYVCFLNPGVLAAFDADTLEMKKNILVPRVASKMALDSSRDRLYVSFPIEGVIRAVDLKSFRVTKTLHSIFGARSLYSDPERGLLFVGGFAPYLEIYRAEDLAFLARIPAPAWQRSMIMDREKKNLIVSTSSGLWEVPLRENYQRSAALDPFFLLQRLIGPAGRRLLQMDISPARDEEVRALVPIRMDVPGED